jgi:hypothetical protein
MLSADNHHYIALSCTLRPRFGEEIYSLGVDLSAKLLEIARAEGPPGIAYVCDDAQTLAAVNDAAFDGVVCNLSLMDIPDLRAYLNTLLDTGFVLERLAEPRASGLLTEQVPGYRDIPALLLAKWRKG